MLDSERISARARAFDRVRREDRWSINPDGEDYYYTSRGMDSYNALLPRYNGQPFLDVLKSRISDSNGPIAILDLGCGQGRALGELVRNFKGRLRAIGVAATDLRQHAPDDLQPFVKQIEMRLGDVHELKEICKNDSFDFIISVKTFEHLAEPEIVAQQCRELLKPQGLAFIEGRDPIASSSRNGVAA